MSAGDVELVRSLFLAAGTDIAAFFRDEEGFAAVHAALEPLFAADFTAVNVMPGQTVGSAVVNEGLDGLQRLWLDWLEPWSTYHSGDHEFSDLGGGQVLVVGRDTGCSHHSDVPIEVAIGSIWTIRDGLVTHAAFFNDQQQALEVARELAQPGSA